MSSNNKISQQYCLTPINNLTQKTKENQQKEIIIDWLFQMNYEDRIKTFSLVNSDICNSIIKIYNKYTSSSKLKFRINLKNKKPAISFSDNHEDIITSSDSYKMNQKLFLNEIRFYKIIESNDAMTLSHKLLNNKNLFNYFFDELSNKKFLSELGQVAFDQKRGVYTCSSPKWIDEKEFYTIAQLIIGYFENILNIKYFLSKKKKNDMNDAFIKFFQNRKLVLDIIKNTSYNEHLYDIIDLKKIISDVINDKQLINDEERRIASKKFLLGVYQPFKMFEPEHEYNANSYYYNYKEMLMEKSEDLLDNLMFFNFDGLCAIDRSIKEKIMDEFIQYSEKKMIQNVINEITEVGFLKKKKNGRKRNKNKNKNKKIENENEKNNNEDINEKVNNVNINSNNKDIKTDINDENYNDNNFELQINIKENEGEHKEMKIKEENNKNNISTISNTNSEELKNDLIQDEIKEINDKINLNENNNIINEIKEKEENIIEIKNAINEENEEKIEKEIETEETNIDEESPEKIKEENIDNKSSSISNTNTNNANKPQKKRHHKKNKKKKYKLTEEELNIIHANFYNENNNFTNPLQKPKINNLSINQKSEKSYYLHNLILSFEKKITKKISSLHEINYNSIIFLCQKIKEHFKCGISIFIYGSYSTGLQLEESDIDISVELLPNEKGKYTNNINLKSTSELISDLNEYLASFPEFKNLFPIINTKIPILKMKILLQNNIETKIDLTFNLKNTKPTITYYNATLKRYPQIKPLTLLIKSLIKKNGLASVFDGGFSSHSIFIMVTANVRQLLKNKNSLNLGDLLSGFLHFYGKIYNYTNSAIDLMNKSNPFIITPFSNVPVFIDPISKTNVSKSSFLHEKLKKLFSDTYDKLVQGEKNLNKTFEEIFF